MLSLHGNTMGTTWSVQVRPLEAIEADALGSRIGALLRHLDREVFSTWTADSELSRLNAGPLGAELAVSADMLAVLGLAQTMHEASRGAFDVSIGPLVNLWGFGPVPASGLPDPAAIDAARQQLGLEALAVDAQAGTVRFERRLALDLSGIAEGYAADSVAALLLDAGHADFLVDVGGELRLQGARPDGRPWSVAIEMPEEGARGVQATLGTRGESIAIAASGDYRNYREVDGVRFSHELDPRTGRPVAHALASVTVIAADAASADAWATALMVLGPEEGRALADSANLAAYFIMRRPSGFEHVETAAFKRYLSEE